MHNPLSRFRRRFPLARRLLVYARPYYRLMLFSLLLILGTTLIVNALPMILQRAIDGYLTGADDALSIDERVSALLRLGGLYLGMACVGFLIRMGQGLLTAWIGQSIVHDLRRDVFAKALRLGIPYYDRTPVGATMTRVTSDVEAVQRFVTDGVVGLAADLFMLLGIAGYMTVLNPRLAAITAVLLPGLILGMETVNRHLRQANRSIRARQSDLNAWLRESLAGMGTIQLFNREDRARDRFDEHNRGLRGAHLEEVRWFSLFFPLIEIGQNGAAALLVGVGGWLVLGGGDVLTVGMLVAILAYVRNFFWPLGDLSDKASSYQQAMAAAERLFELFDTPEEPGDPIDAPPAADRWHGDIRFEHVSFAYPNGDRVLHDIDFTIRRGEAVAVVGATGAGKSTLINLLMRFHEVTEGRITVGGEDIRRFRLPDLRRAVGLVLQEPFVMAGTVAENIGLNRPGIGRADIERAARHVNAAAFIERLPDRYDTRLGGQGGGLSAGEKQLLAMARALARQPDLVLVLDEATANVDTRTETLVQEALRRLMHERTTIVIAHRLSTIRDADRILVMRDGRLTDQGTHAELMRRDAYYRHLVALLRIET